MKSAPYIALFISVTTVSFAAILIEIANEISPDLHPLTIAFYRLFFTTALLAPLFIVHQPSRDELMGLSRRSLLIMGGIGIALALHFSSWIASLELTSISSSVFLVTAHPIIVAPLSFILLKEALSKRNITGILISLLGVFILVFGNNQFSLGGLDSLEGNLLAFIGGIAAGIYILGGRLMRKNISVITYAFIVYFITTVILFLLCAGLGVLNNGVTELTLLLFLAMAVTSGILGHTLYNWSLGYVRASVASVALLGEPLGSTLWAFILPLSFLQQIPTVYTLLGGVCILSGIYLASKKKKEKTAVIPH